ncbi:golgin subfamily A member 6-like protein 22 [Venturia canescens]|uniref:golgin subfamily A member 6-like protein 22 n=1 Tax=Venturia canescens TaxID=32260 RepID=UPI001C9C1276|nr:golgin subfamily A member 6-like protein 22 [Venturia canescens]
MEAILAGDRKKREREEGMARGEDGGEVEAFKRSRKLARSPEREEGEADEIVRRVGEMMKELLKQELRQECGRIESKVDRWAEEVRKEHDEMRRQWGEEREMFKKKIEELERKVEVLEKERGEGGEGGERIGRRVWEVEKELERREREERRNNIVVRGVNVAEGVEWEREIEKIWERLGVDGGRKEMRRIGRVDEGGRGMVLIRLEGREKKVEIMKAKVKLRGNRERIEDDLTKEERRIKWLVEGQAYEERRKGKRDEEFWEGIKRWDVVVMSETWATEEGWGAIREGWKKGFRWVIQGAKRGKGRGRAKGGMAFGVKEEIEEEEGGTEPGEEGWMERRVKLGTEWWMIVGVYVNGDMERKKELMSRWMERAGGGKVVIGGDMNVRTGREGGGWDGWRVGEREAVRSSRDEIVTKEGKEWCKGGRRRMGGNEGENKEGDEED